MNAHLPIVVGHLILEILLRNTQNEARDNFKVLGPQSSEKDGF